jgi:arylsulfatase A-like enzyme
MSCDEPRQTTPNILWILAEDIGPELGSYGYPVDTPHLDRLAEEGVRFTQAFTTAPVCSPARSALMTGMYQTTIGAHNHRSHRDDGYPLPDGVRVLTDRLRDQGYYTGNIVRLAGLEFQGTGKTDWNFMYDGEPFDTDQWSDLKNHQPFYAQVNFPETHRGTEWDEAERRVDPAAVVLPPYYPDHPIVRDDWAQYLNAVMALDRKVGLVLELLERDGLSDNTVVMFMGDHGRAMVRGKQWPYDSGLHVPLIIRGARGTAAGSVNDELIASIDVTATTLAIAGVTPPERMQGRVFLGAARAEPREYVFGGRDRGDETLDRIRTVRDRRFRYIRNYYPERPFLQLNRYKEFTYPTIPVMRELHAQGELTPVQARLLAPTRPEEELYDLESDPYEIENLASDSDYHDTLERMRGELDAWIEASDDQGRFPETEDVLQYWEDRMHEVYGDPR